MVTKEELVEVLLKYREIEIVRALEIRDTLTHVSEIANVSLYNIQTVSVINELDQPLTVQVKGNWTPTTTHAVDIGASFDVAINTQETRTLTPDTSGWLPFIFVTLTCATAPTKGAVHVRILAKPL